MYLPVLQVWFWLQQTAAHRPDDPQCPKRLLKAIATATKEVGILRIELMVFVAAKERPGGSSS